MNTIGLKTPSELKIMQTGGRQLAQVRDWLQAYSRPGRSLLQIEEKAQKLIKESGGEPGFARVPGYSWATCLNVNDGFVHGIPNGYRLKSGDVLSIDVGIYYKGFNTDTAVTFLVGQPADSRREKEVQKFLGTGRKTLTEAIKIARPGNRVGHISQAIQIGIESAGYSVSRSLTGHGIGRILHEAPKIPCFVNQPINQTELLEPGMTIAVEVLYLAGKAETVVDSDQWTIKSKDGKITGIFEKTIAIRNDGCIVLT